MNANMVRVDHALYIMMRNVGLDSSEYEVLLVTVNELRRLRVIEKAAQRVIGAVSNKEQLADELSYLEGTLKHG